MRVVSCKRRYRCHETRCEARIFSPGPLAGRPAGQAHPPRGRLGRSSVALPLHRGLGPGTDALFAWNTVWFAVTPVIEAQLAARIVNPSREESGWPRVRLLDLVDGHTAVAHGAWLAGQGEAYTGSIRESTLDPFHGYANAILGELPEAISVVGAFHVVELGGQIVEAGRRRVPQDTLSRRGRASDPWYGTAVPYRSGQHT